LRLVLGHDADVAAYVAHRIPGVDDFGPCAGLGVVDSEGRLVAGVVFHDYQPQFGNIQVSFASDRADWLTPSLVRAIMRYPFTQLKVNRITTLTPKRNRRARQFLKKFGFRLEGVIRKGFGTDDCMVSGLMRTEWESHRFNGQKQATSSSST
jgi:RimJ/RimL family protein N-acetyltransferase